MGDDWCSTYGYAVRADIPPVATSVASLVTVTSLLCDIVVLGVDLVDAFIRAVGTVSVNVHVGHSSAEKM